MINLLRVLFISLFSINAFSLTLSFSGGGFRSYTNLWAIHSGLVDIHHNSLKKVYKNVELVSANSGGSWFSAQFFYSRKFNKIFMSKKKWRKNEYISGLLQHLGFDELCNNFAYPYSIICYKAEKLRPLFVAAMIKNGGIFSFNQEAAMIDLIFNKVGIYDELNNKKLSSPMLPYFKNIDLVFLATIFSSDVYFNSRTFLYDKKYNLKLKESFLASNDAYEFFSLPVILGKSITSPLSHFEYQAETRYFRTIVKHNTALEIPFEISTDINILTASAISSAALAGLTSSKVSRYVANLIGFTEQTSLAMIINNNAAQFRAFGENFFEYNSDEDFIFRVGDGAYNDNSSLIAAISRIQKKSAYKKKFFSIFLVNTHNNKDLADMLLKLPLIAKDTLIKRNINNNILAHSFSYQHSVGIKTFTPKVFEFDNIKRLSWVKYKDLNLDLLEIDIQTLDFPLLSIEAGWVGKLYVFSISSALTSKPLKGMFPFEKSTFDSYEDNYIRIRKAVNEKFKPHLLRIFSNS